jgi:hypothetical protein
MKLRFSAALASLRALDSPAEAVAIQAEIVAFARRIGRRTVEVTTLGNVSEDARRTGDWDWVVGELEMTREHEVDEAIAVVLEECLATFRMLRGDFPDEDVEGLVRRIEALDDRDVESSAFDLRALRAVTHREWATAQAEWWQGVEMSDYNAPYMLPRIASAAILGRDPVAARRALDEMAALGTRGRAVDADLTTIRAGIAALEGDRAAARSGYRAGLAAYRDLGLAWDEALLGLQAVTTLGPEEPEARAAGENARPILERLRAAPVLRYLERLLADGESTAERRGDGAPDVASPGEEELATR